MSMIPPEPIPFDPRSTFLSELSSTQIMFYLMESLNGPDGVKELLFKMVPDSAPVVVDVPMFHWNFAHDMKERLGTDHATVIGLSMISEQLNAMLEKLS